MTALLCVVVPSLRLMALIQAECVSRVTATHLVQSPLTVMRWVSVVVSQVSLDPSVTAAHEDSSTSKKGAAHVSADSGIKCANINNQSTETSDFPSISNLNYKSGTLHKLISFQFNAVTQVT